MLIKRLRPSPFALSANLQEERGVVRQPFLASALKETWKLFPKPQQTSELIPRQKADSKHGRRDSYITRGGHVSVWKLILTGTTREGKKSAAPKNIPASGFHNSMRCQRLKVTGVNRGGLPSPRPRTTRTNTIHKLLCQKTRRPLPSGWGISY